MNNVNELYLEIEDSIGLEAYNYYVKSDERHSIIEEVVTGIAASILFEFIKPFIDFEGISNHIKEFFKRNKAPIFHELTEIEMLNKAIEFISMHPEIFNLNKKKVSELKIKQYLLSINYPEQTAARKSVEITSLLYKKFS
jgi:hypothetical protein